jgi:hypothetical protein
MAGQQITLGLLISATGGSKTIAELLALQAAAKKIADEAPGIARLANSFGISGNAAKKLSADIGKTPDEILEIAESLKAMKTAGASSAEQVLGLSAKFGLTSEQAIKLQSVLGKTFDGQSSRISQFGDGVGALAFKFNNVVTAIQSLAAAAKPAYDLLIGSNEKLNAQLLSSQTNLASSTRISQGGQDITDPIAKIQATQPALKAALKQVEDDTRSLVGVTSSQVNELFQITLTNAAALNNQSKQFPDPIAAATSLTKGWAASLKVIGIPLDQARQEINSIVKGQVDQNSILAKNLNISNEQINKWKSQGTLVDELNKRLEVFVAGNKIASNSIEGIGSNIQELFEVFGRNAGAPFLQPTIDALQAVFDYLDANKEAINQFLSEIASVLLSTGQQLGTALEPFGKTLLSIGEQAGPILLNAFEGLSSVFAGLVTALAPIANFIAQIIEQIALFANTDIGGIAVQAVVVTAAFVKLGTIVAGFAAAAMPAAIVAATGLSGAFATLSTAVVALATGGIPALTAAFPALIAGLGAVSTAALPVAAALAPLAGAIALTFLVKGTEDLKKSQEELDLMRNGTEQLADESIKYASKLRNLAQAQKENGSLTAAQAKEQRTYADLAKQTIAANEAQIIGLKALNPASKEQISQQQIQIAELERMNKTLSSASGGIKIQGKELEVLGSSYEQLAKKVNDSNNAINNAQTNEEASKAAKELIKTIESQQELAVKSGKITTDAAVEQLKAIEQNKKLEVDVQKEASEAIVKIRKGEITQIKDLLEQGTLSEVAAIGRLQELRSKAESPEIAKAAAGQILAIRKDTVAAEVATIQAGIAEIEAKKAKGDIKDVDAEKATTKLKQEELKKRVDLAREEVDLTSGNDRTKALANLKKLSAELEKEKAESIKRVKALEQKARDEQLALELAQIKAQIAQVEAAKASGRIDDVEAEKKISALKIEELEKQAKAAEERANAESDPKVREKLKAEADRLNAEVEKAAAESVARILAIKLKAVEEENAKALALVKLSEQERNNEIQRGLNTQTTNQEQAQKAKLDTLRSTLEQELEAAQNNQKKLEELEGEITNPKAREEYEKRKLEAATKTAGAIGKLLENEAQQIEFQRQQTIRIIEREQEARSKAIDLQIAQANKLAAVRNASATTAELASQREIAAIDAANRALQTQGKILDARNRLEKARLDAALFLAEKSGNPEAAAAVKAAQFAAEQTAQQASLAQQIKAEDFANRRAIIEAKINELKAKQAVLTAQQAVAEANLTAAKAKGEADAALAKANTLAPGAAKDKAVADAKQQQALAAEQGAAQKANAGAGLEVAKQGAQLAGEAVKEATQNAAASKESQALQQQALNLEQQTAKARFESEQSIARQNALLGQQQATQNTIANDAERTNAARNSSGGQPTALPGRKDGGSVTANTAYLVGEREPEIFIPNVSGTILNQAQITRNLSALQAAQTIGGMGTPTIAFSQNSTVSMGQDAIVSELQALRKLVGDRQPISQMNATFEAPDSGSFDQFAKLQRSLLRNKL